MKSILFAAVMALSATSALAADNCHRDLLDCAFEPAVVEMNCERDLLDCAFWTEEEKAWAEFMTENPECSGAPGNPHA